jgi:hypothetical protein
MPNSHIPTRSATEDGEPILALPPRNVGEYKHPPLEPLDIGKTHFVLTNSHLIPPELSQSGVLNNGLLTPLIQEIYTLQERRINFSDHKESQKFAD